MTPDPLLARLREILHDEITRDADSDGMPPAVAQIAGALRDRLERKLRALMADVAIEYLHCKDGPCGPYPLEQDIYERFVEGKPSDERRA